MQHRYVAHAKPISEGRTGRILAAVDRLTGEEVALKFVFVSQSEANGLSHALMRETATWALLSSNDHPHVLKLRDVFTSGACVVFVSSRVQTDLHCVLNSYGADAKRMPFADAGKKILRQIASALSFLHSNGVLHRDVKPANILCRSRSGEDIVLGDFGLSRCIHCDDGAGDDDNENRQRQRPRMTHEVVSRAYRAPELLLGCTNYGAAIDMWAFGCVAADVVAGSGCTPLFASSSDLEQLRRVFDVIGSPRPDLYRSLLAADAAASSASVLTFTMRPPKANWAAAVARGHEHGADFFQRLLCHDPAHRMSADEALRHPFLAE